MSKWHKVPPGACVSLLGLSAAIYATVIDHPSDLQKALWIVGFCLLAVGEIWVCYRERDNAEQAAASDRALAYDHFQRMLRLERSINDPTKKLRTELLELCGDLIQFRQHRREITPREALGGSAVIGALGLGGNVFAPWLKHRQETHTMFRERFGKRTTDVLDELKKYGLEDSELNSLSQEDEMDETGIFLLVNRLEQLSDLLPKQP